MFCTSSIGQLLWKRSCTSLKYLSHHRQFKMDSMEMTLNVNGLSVAVCCIPCQLLQQLVCKRPDSFFQSLTVFFIIEFDL